jgi:dTDP-4-dehydrorhamnose 3,5-epimerase
MQIFQTEIPDVKVFTPDVFEDDRGHFFESYNKELMSSIGIDADFVQDNQSLSFKNILRGLHYQSPPYQQGKLVRVLKGAVLDVAVDIRKNSLYYGKWVSQEISSENKLIMWIPPGFAHGFLTLQEENIFCYKCTNYYHRDSERVLIWNDPDLKINWGISSPLISDRDSKGTRFKDFNSLFY